MKYSLPVIAVAAFLLLVRCSSGKREASPFTVSESDQSLELRENDKPVFVYRRKPKISPEGYVCNNYIHPLYDLQGNVMTEEFPPDHPYHRGVFWAWHQLYVRGRRLGDGWTNDSISYQVIKSGIQTGTSEAVLRTDVNWISDVLGRENPFMNEKTTVTVHSLEGNIRIIDFELRLRALVRNLQIGGSADVKGYGGFCVRLRLPDSLVFTSENGPVTPQELQIKAGPWMDFSGKFGPGEDITGMTILCAPNMPDYPEPWILRQKGSMQNVVFPGSGRIGVPVNGPLILHYRMLIHNGDAGSTDIRLQKQEYAKIYND